MTEMNPEKPRWPDRFWHWCLGGGSARSDVGNFQRYSQLKSLAVEGISARVGRRVDISDRALEALSCYAARYKDNPMGTKFTNFGADEILQKLVKSSPLIFNHLVRCGVDVSKLLFWLESASPGYPTLGLYRYIVDDDDLVSIIRETGCVDEFMLFRAILCDGFTELFSRVQIGLDRVLSTPVYDKDFVTGSRNFELLLYLDDDHRAKMRPFGAAGKIVDGSFANDMERVKRLNIFTERRFSRFLLSDECLGEFENLINDKSATEFDVQNFFEKNPIFLAGFEYSNIRPHLALVPEGGRKMIPDFFLEPIDDDYMSIVELKKPFAKITTRKSNGSRARLTQNVREGIAQLLEYRRFFEVGENRRLFVERYGVRAYRPMMTLIIGRDSEFRGKNEVVNLSEELPNDVELCTYDVLLRRAIMYREMAGQ